MESKKIKNFILIFIMFLTSFILGFNSYYFSLNKEIGTYLDKINFVKNYTNLENNQNNKLLSDLLLKKDLDLNKFWEVYNLISKNYYSSDTIKQKDLVYGATKGLVESLGDKFSEFMVPEENKKFSESLSGDFEGIGAVVDKNEMGVIVDRLIKGSPALKADIKKGDIIIKANNEDLSELSLYDAVDKIKGKAGTKVDLIIFRAGEKELLKKEVTREKITIPSVDSKILEKTNLGYISLNIFGENTASEFNTALEDLKSKKVSGIIIDLRDNGGGYLQSAVDILSNFTSKGKLLVTTKYKNSYLNNYYYSDNIGDLTKTPLVVLVNENTASASEITAGALKDYNLAIITGKKSYGKGSVQEPFDLGDGSMLKLTIAKWYTPKDYNIDKQGIKPDIEIDFKKEDIEKKYDRQLEESKNILEKFIKIGNIAATIEQYKKENNISNSGSTTSTGKIN
ncbi:MAG: S41 family peptidase [Candidatus Gracilibacteria bacterium]|nr:S41 family peptidase [Candidatus Gracilibacteria bacterium]